MNILEKTKNVLWVLNIFFTIVLFVIAFKMATQTKGIPKTDNSEINEIIEKQNDLQEKIDNFKIVGDSLTEKIQNHETQKVIIKNYYHEKISAIDTVSVDELMRFFTDRYSER